MRHLRFLVVGRREEGCDCPKVLLGQSSRPPIGFTHTRSSLRSVPCPCRSIDGKSVVDHDPSFIVVGALAPLILPFAVTASPGGYWSSAWPLQSPPPSLMRSRCRSRARCVRASMRMTAMVVVQSPSCTGSRMSAQHSSRPSVLDRSADAPGPRSSRCRSQETPRTWHRCLPVCDRRRTHRWRRPLRLRGLMAHLRDAPRHRRGTWRVGSIRDNSLFEVVR
jgi:hypothetical protein